MIYNYFTLYDAFAADSDDDLVKQSIYNWRGFFLLQIYVFDSKYNNLAAFSVSEVASQPCQGGADVLIEEAIPVDNNVR